MAFLGDISASLRGRKDEDQTNKIKTKRERRERKEEEGKKKARKLGSKAKISVFPRSQGFKG